VIFGLLAGSSPAMASDAVASGPVTPVTQYLYCTAIESPRQLDDGSMSLPAIYYTGPFMAAGRDLIPVYTAFFEFLKKTYVYAGQYNPGIDQQCYGRASLEEAQAEEQKQVSKGQQYSDRQKVVETGWTYAAP